MVRIPLVFSGDQIVLVCAIECKSLRIHKRLARFIIDTGSINSFLSTKDVISLQVPVSGVKADDQVDFGGSRFDRVELPKFNIYVFKEDKNSNEYITLKIKISALRSNKKSKEKIQIAESLPSILGMDFLKEQRLALYVNPAEKISYMEKAIS